MDKKKDDADMDKAIIAADDTGLLDQQEEINEEEILLGEEGKSLEDEPRD